jgi:hypothetical protein
MIFYSLSDSTFTRLYREEIEMAFSAIDCVLNREKAIYASAELTTGRRLYDALREFRVKRAADLKQLKGKDWYTANIWDANVKSAQDFAACVREKLGGNTLVITPAPFSAPGWTQPEYLAFWEQLLRTRISSSWFKSDWQYSNGCTFEFAVSINAGIPTLDHQGIPLSLRQGTKFIEAAIRDLESSGFDTTKLHENLSRLQGVPAISILR